MIPRQLILRVQGQFQLDWLGIHGVRHWSRVRVNGLRLADITGADRQVVECFAFLHDVCRVSDHGDHDHGHRAADFIRNLPPSVLGLEVDALETLINAVEGHTNGKQPANVTVATCWDADRLDLGRISVRPDPAYLFTDAAKCPSFIEKCWRRARVRHPGG